MISFLGNPTNLRRIENDRTIVLYVLSAGDENSVEKALLNNLFDDLKQYCQCRGYELQLCDLHEVSEQFVDPQRWKTEPANGRGGYHLLAEYLSAITSNYLHEQSILNRHIFSILLFLTALRCLQ